MTFPVLQNSFISGEISPSLWGRTDKPQYRNGASTMRNTVVNYRGGGMSRAGFAYVGMCKQGAPNTGGVGSLNTPPRDINFQYSINQGFALEFGDQYMRIKFQGAYVTETAKNITAATLANPLVITSVAHGFSNGDWIFIDDMVGMTNLNGLVWVVVNRTADTFELTDLFGNAVSSLAFGVYVSGGTAERIYTVVSPYAAVDLPYLKFTQSANVMNLVCWNQQTLTEYAPYDLERVAQTNWTFTAVTFGSGATAPTGITAVANASTTLDTWYAYVVTSVDGDADESVASSVANVHNNNISINAGSNTVTWTPVAGAASYNIYGATSSYSTGATATTPVGAVFGFVGSSFGSQFIDSNITADFTVTPPLHNNPFARGSILGVTRTAAGSSYTQASIGYSIGTTNGTGFAGTPIVVNGQFSGFYIQNNGAGYKSGDTLVISDSGSGHGATATLSVGAQTGTYPGTAQYFQQRLVYANTINEPDTYFMSHPGTYNVFDGSLPTNDGDAVIGTPWGVQINGIQFMVPTISGLLTFTGNGVWLINGGSATAITPSDQSAQAQAQIGCSAIIPPLYLNLHLLYVQAKGSIVRDIAFNFLYNVFQGTDITVFSNHLFSGYTLLQWAYSEEPYKVVWAVRNDGAMLSLTYIKEQEVQGWARHDTNGLFAGVCSVIEPPVDAIYAIIKRYIVGEGVWAYYSERANNRIWQNVEDCFCVDAGLAYPLTYPAATLMPASLTGTNNITSTNLVTGGTGYTAPSISAFDPAGTGTGATFTYTLAGGVITSITPVLQGEDYSQGTYLLIADATGSGAIAQAVVTNYVHFTASAGVFSAGNVGDVLRVDGGKATVVSYVSATEVIANVTQALTSSIPDDPNALPVPATSGSWSVSTPVSTVTGLNHLEGMTVSILADGGAEPQQVVTDGAITLQQAASSIVVGLPFIAQLQAMYLDPPSQTTTQGKRKDVQAMTLRLEQSRGVTVGTNQPDQSTQQNNATVPWTNMKPIKERNALNNAGSALPLYTGDYRVLLPGEWNEKGQVAIQQVDPLPFTCNALVPEYDMGDSNG